MIATSFIKSYRYYFKYFKNVMQLLPSSVQSLRKYSQAPYLLWTFSLPKLLSTAPYQ